MQTKASADNQRTFRRRQVRIDILFTPLVNQSGILNSNSRPLKMEGTTKNISAGGALVETPYRFDESTYLLAQLIIKDCKVPHVILCKSTWSEACRGQKGRSRCGIKFITKERVPAFSLVEDFDNLPPEAFAFTRKKQQQLDKYLQSLD
jgi:c-di-GMP-binding flagellar brake protein YcgR